MVYYCFCRKESADLHVTLFLLLLFDIPSHAICRWFFFAVICEITKCTCIAENLAINNEINYSALRWTAVCNLNKISAGPTLLQIHIFSVLCTLTTTLVIIINVYHHMHIKCIEVFIYIHNSSYMFEQMFIFKAMKICRNFYIISELKYMYTVLRM